MGAQYERTSIHGTTCGTDANWRARARRITMVGRRNAGIDPVIRPNGELHTQSDGHIATVI
jgi:hypothetical protein